MPEIVSEAYRPRLWNRLLRPLLRVIFRGVFHLLSRVEISGVENVPTEGAYLIAFNHISLYDAPLVVAFWPTAPEIAGAADVWQRPGQSILARTYGGIPVNRDQYDRRMLAMTISVLRSGYPLIIAPEGGRSHNPGMRKAKPGIAFLIEKAQVPVVPVGVVGGTDDFLARAMRGERPTIEMHIGPPIPYSPAEEHVGTRREARQKNTDRVMAQIAALLPVEYRGVYIEDADRIIQASE